MSLSMSQVFSCGTTSEHPVSDFERTLAVNLTGTFVVCRELIPSLLETRFDCECLIDNGTGRYPLFRSVCVIKAGVLALTKSLAVEYAKQGIQVNCVNLEVLTAMTKMPPIMTWIWICCFVKILLRHSPSQKQLLAL